MEFNAKGMYALETEQLENGTWVVTHPRMPITGKGPTKEAAGVDFMQQFGLQVKGLYESGMELPEPDIEPNTATTPRMRGNARQFFDHLKWHCEEGLTAAYEGEGEAVVGHCNAIMEHTADTIESMIKAIEDKGLTQFEKEMVEDLED